MKKLILLTVAVFLVASAVSFATCTRTLTMGDANMVLHDENNIWMFPQTLYDYPEMVIGEFYESYWYSGVSDGPWDTFSDIGIHYKFGEEKPFVLGLYFTQQQPYYIPNYPYSFDYQNNKRIDLFFSKMMGNHKFGFRFNYVSGSWKDDVDSTEETSIDKEEQGVNAMEFTFGLTPNNGKLDLGAVIGFMSWTDKNYRGLDKTKPKGNLEIGAGARYWYDYSQKITFVPHVGVVYRKEGIERYADNADLTSLDRTDTYKYMAAELGWGMNYTPAAGVLAIGDFGVTFSKWTDKYEPTAEGATVEEDKYTETCIPYFKVGMEATVLKWLDVRMGGTSYWYNDKDQYDYSDGGTFTEKYLYHGVSNDLYLGAGVHWGNFYGDLYMNSTMIANGFYFLSGIEEPLAWQVSLKYKMF